ncbi:serine/threonine-protein kinase [Sorangium sp. So ce291]|uniref:serine/threonine-protein kinase n=1 Tax=Sorangium sp. So ce291 TaxID=3133294 RepID=UPI003F6338F2
MSHGENSAGDDDVEAPLPLAPYPLGSVVAGHRLVRLIGSGGLSAVYEAVHEFTQRRVALKLLLASHASSARARERARKEAIALCRLRHRNIVTVHSADTLPDGTVWLAMERLEGQSLRRICQVESPLPVARGLHVGIELADGLAAAHELGIVHRDVKPENVFLDRDGEVKLLDLNIAKIHVDGMLTTRPGQRFGTVAYMAPEECFGDPCTPASDVYSMMLVIYELLAGRYAFATGRGLSGLPDEKQLVAAHMFRMPAPLHEVEPSIPPYFWPVFQLGLAKQPDARFRHAGAAASALRELRERYLSDVRAGRLLASQDAGPPGARREHHVPQSPGRLSTAPLSTDDRVILTGAAAAADLGGGEASEPGAAAAARVAVPAMDLLVNAPPPNAPPATESGWPMAVTPGPVTVRSLPGGHGSSPQVSGVPPTDRIADRRRRAQLVRRCIAAGVLAIPISGAATALYIHMDRGRSEAAVPTAAASASGAAASASGAAATSASGAAASGAAAAAAASGAAAAAAASGAAAAVSGKDRPATAEGQARGSAVAGRAAGAEVAGAPTGPGAASPAVPPRAPARPGAGPARSAAARSRADLSEDVYEDEEDIYGVPSGGRRGVPSGGRVPAPAQPVKPRRGKGAGGPVGGPPRF